MFQTANVSSMNRYHEDTFKNESYRTAFGGPAELGVVCKIFEQFPLNTVSLGRHIGGRLQSTVTHVQGLKSDRGHIHKLCRLTIEHTILFSDII